MEQAHFVGMRVYRVDRTLIEPGSDPMLTRGIKIGDAQIRR